MSQNEESSIQLETSPSHSPSSPRTPPLAVIPRTRPRRDSNIQPAQPAPITHINSSNPSNPSNPPTVPSSTTTSTSSSSQLPLITPSTTPPNTLPSIPSGGGGGVGGTSGAVQMFSKSRPQTAASPSTSVSGLAVSSGGGVLGYGASTPQTGASKMAAAAKRGQAGLDGSPSGVGGGGNGGVPDGEDHPLSDKSLKARGYQAIHTHNRLFHLPDRWNLIRPLGQGAYGLVISVQDSLSGEPVAVKCITRVFDKVILARRALREITLLRHFGDHENLTGLIDLDNVWDGYNEIYLYMEPMEADLHQIVRSGQALSNSHIQYFVYQLLRGMKYIHSANVIHRDLKPGNLLVNADCELKICDFGLARGFRPVTGEQDQNEELKLTEYVATRWYRAPEVMLSNRRYTTAMDVWSIGCILAELLGGKPLFKGKDYIDQLNLILGVLGTPDDETLDRVGSENAVSYIRTLPRSEPVPLQLILPDADSQSLDLLSHLITFDPAERIDVPIALTHPYVGAYHDPSDEPSCPEIFTKWEQVESLDTIGGLREGITQEIEEYRAEVRAMPAGSDEEGQDGPAGDEGGEETLLDEESSLVGNPPMVNGRVSGIPADLGISSIATKPSIPFPKHARDLAPEGTPPTPISALSVVSEDATTTSPVKSRTSRRSSGHSHHHPSHRRPSSFLFSNPLGSGMTPMNGSMSLPPGSGGFASVLGGSGSSVSGGPGWRGMGSGAGGGGVGAEEGWTRPRSRAPNSTGEIASLAPIIRRLSTVGLDGMGRGGGGGKRTTSGETAESGLEEEMKVPPMLVSPSDAPASEVPKRFAA